MKPTRFMRSTSREKNCNRMATRVRSRLNCDGVMRGAFIPFNIGDAIAVGNGHVQRIWAVKNNRTRPDKYVSYRQVLLRDFKVERRLFVGVCKVLGEDPSG